MMKKKIYNEYTTKELEKKETHDRLADTSKDRSTEKSAMQDKSDLSATHTTSDIANSTLHKGGTPASKFMLDESTAK